MRVVVLSSVLLVLAAQVVDPIPDYLRQQAIEAERNMLLAEKHIQEYRSKWSEADTSFRLSQRVYNDTIVQAKDICTKLKLNFDPVSIRCRP